MAGQYDRKKSLAPPDSSFKQIMWNKIYIVGTHHKSGTTWMESLFSEFAQLMGIEFIDYGYMKEFEGRTYNIASTNSCILFSHDATLFDLSLMEDGKAAGFHLVRDPRDVAISGAIYHTRPDVLEGEKWLLEPFGIGGSYRDALVAINSFEDRVTFEACNVALATSENMVRVHEAGILQTIKYEDLYLAFGQKEKSFCIKDALQLDDRGWEIFYGCFARTHIESGNLENLFQANSGKPEQYKNLSRSTQAGLLRVLGNCIERLGYQL